MPFELPLFPLGLVLFPGMPQPLHIFEPRYRLMMARCLEGDKTFGIVQIVVDNQGELSPMPALVGTAAEIIEVVPFADGRMNIQTVGTRRFKVVSVRELDEYLIGTCEWLEDEEPEEELDSLAQETRHTLSRYFDAMALNTELPPHLSDIVIPQTAYDLSMFIAAILTIPDAQKQDLLEMTDTRVRLEVENFLLERATIVQIAYAKRVADGLADKSKDTSLGEMAEFVWLN